MNFCFVLERNKYENIVYFTFIIKCLDERKTSDRQKKDNLHFCFVQLTLLAIQLHIILERVHHFSLQSKHVF